MSPRKFGISGLNLNDVDHWPRPAKIGCCVLVGLLTVALAWVAIIRHQSQALAALEHREEHLRREFEQAQGRAVKLQPLKQQLGQLEQALQQQLRLLPSRTEMTELIIAISRAALSSGLSNELFQPGPESPQAFYAEKPITLRMVGSYHQFGAFVSDVASLPGVVILTMHDIHLKPKDSVAGRVPRATLELSGTVKTYRYLDEDEWGVQDETAVAATKPSQGKD